MFRLIFPSQHRCGRWLFGAAPILSDPKPKADPIASAKNSPLGAELDNDLKHVCPFATQYVAVAQLADLTTSVGAQLFYRFTFLFTTSPTSGTTEAEQASQEFSFF